MLKLEGYIEEAAEETAFRDDSVVLDKYAQLLAEGIVVDPAVLPGRPKVHPRPPKNLVLSE